MQRNKKIIGSLTSLVMAGIFFAIPVAGQDLYRQSDTQTGQPTTTTQTSHRPRIGLALGGGGSRGSAHVGVLKVLEEEHIPIDVISGTSIGSVVGGFYAAGIPLDQIAETFQKDEFIKEFIPLLPIVRLSLEPVELTARLLGYRPYDGLYFSGPFRQYADRVTGGKKIEDLHIPYAAVVTNVVTGKSCRLTTGDLGLAMQASTAVPGLKRPVQIGDKLYCDGGLICNVPVTHARDLGADFVIAVNIDEGLEEKPLDKFRVFGSMGKQALRIQLASQDDAYCEKADVTIHPDTTGIGLISRKRSDGQKGIDAGVKAARDAMPELKRKLAALGVVLAASPNSVPN
jgi:NTE family protein